MTDQNPERTALFAALAKAQASARSIEKDAVNQFHRYEYASAESMLRAKRHLNSHGLALIPVSSRHTRADGGGGWDLDVAYLLTHSDGGCLDLAQMWVFAEGKGRPLDKALAGALTTALAYQYRGILGLDRIEKGTAPDERDDRDHEPEPQESRSRAKKIVGDAVALEDRDARIDFFRYLEDHNASTRIKSLVAAVFKSAEGADYDPEDMAAAEGLLGLPIADRSEAAS